jgi:hypothetical protein
MKGLLWHLTFDLLALSLWDFFDFGNKELLIEEAFGLQTLMSDRRNAPWLHLQQICST